ncbi:MAG: hypothetical protein ACOC7L_01945 [Acidobacteriota bacterium]
MRHLRSVIVAVLALGLFTTGCDDTLTTPDGDHQADRSQRRAGPNVVNVTAKHQAFETSQQEIARGWTTFRFKNRSHAPHFMIIEKMPEVNGDQKTVEDSKAEVVPVFQNIMDDINGQAPSFPDAGFTLPDWFDQVVFLGGPGLTSPGETSETRVHLEPGTYVIECYVKTEDGVFHSTNGMIEGLVVNERSNAASEPAGASARVTVSSTDGIQVDGDVGRPGVHTFEVHFDDQTAYSHFLGHDVHLVRLEDGVGMEKLETWMNWVVPGGLAGHVPEGATFLGGVQDMPAGSTAYMTARLTPGDYAWIAEVPDPSAEGMLVTFSVP